MMPPGLRERTIERPASVPFADRRRKQQRRPFVLREGPQRPLFRNSFSQPTDERVSPFRHSSGGGAAAGQFDELVPPHVRGMRPPSQPRRTFAWRRARLLRRLRIELKPIASEREQISLLCSLCTRGVLAYSA